MKSPGLRGRLSLIYNTALPLLLAAAILLPVLPSAPLGGVPSLVAQGLKKISVVQNWSMYAPDPQRAHTYLALYAEFADGRREALVEADQANNGWTHTWGWNKTRVDIWRFYAVLNSEKPNNNRTWYMRSVCVREALARGEAPTKIFAERVRRGFTNPAKVRAGKPDLGPISRKPIGSVDCRTFPVRDMLARREQP